MSRNADTFTLTVVAQTVIPADDLVSFHRAHAERDPAVKTDVLCRRQAAVGKGVDHQPSSGRGGGVSFLRPCMDKGDRIQKRGEPPPVGLTKCASARKSASR